MKNHHHQDLIDVLEKDAVAFRLGEMDFMWILMILMFVWMYFMQVRHSKFKKVFNEVVNCQNCKFSDKYNT